MKKTGRVIPFSLIYFKNKIGTKPSDKIGKFFVTINIANVATRYPEDLKILSKNFAKNNLKYI